MGGEEEKEEDGKKTKNSGRSCCISRQPQAPAHHIQQRARRQQLFCLIWVSIPFPQMHALDSALKASLLQKTWEGQSLALSSSVFVLRHKLCHGVYQNFDVSGN